jgi:hypothetical protein
MSYPLGTILASPIVGGGLTDTYGTHHSYLGVGGWQEFQTIAERNLIPVDALGNLDASGLGSGRRRLGMLAYVAETDTLYQLFVPYTSWSGLTNNGKVLTLANNTNWNTFSSGGGDATKKKYQQTSHSFSVGNVVSFNGSSFVKAIASIGNTFEVLGIVSSVIDPDNFTLTYNGFIDLSSVIGLSANTVYFVSPSVAGAITAIEPFNAGETSKPIIVTQQLNKGIVLTDRGFTISNVGASSGGTGGSGLRIQRTTTTISAHGFVLGDVIEYSGSSYQKAIASRASDFPIGIVNSVINPTSFIVCFGGYVDGLTSAFDSTGTKHLSGSTVYYLSPTVAGKLTRTKPTAPTHIVKPIYQSITTDDGIVINQKGLPTYTPISGVTGLTAALNLKVNTSAIGAASGIVPLNASSIIPIQYIPPGLKEEFVVPTIAARNAQFYTSGGTGTTGQTMSFRGLKVYVLNATGGQPQVPVGFTGSSEFIDVTGHLKWSATTMSVFIQWSDIKSKPNLVNRILAGTGITASNNGTGNTIVDLRYDDKYINITSTGNSLQVKQSSIDATRVKFQGGSGSTGQYITRGTGNTFQAITLPPAVIGAPEDGTYNDGIYQDFITTTPVGIAVDRFNEMFLAVVPSPPPSLNNIDGIAPFVSGKLSWGVSRNDIGFVNVGTNAGNSAVDINQSYVTGGTRLGIINNSITGVLNSTTIGDGSGIPFFNNAFSRADQGKLIMYKNGANVGEVSLIGAVGKSNSRFNVSVLSFVKSPNGTVISGTSITEFKYRVGTYTIPISGMSSGFNYFRISHSASTFLVTTNYLEFVYDPDSNTISAASTGLTNITLTGTKNISGVKYHTSGSVDYSATISNAYKNVYSSLSNAINFHSKINLGGVSNILVSGAGIIARTGGTLQTLPNLNSAVSNPQNTNIGIVATFPITASTVLGSIGNLGKLRSGISIAHPITSQKLSGGTDTKTGFLLNNITQSNTLNLENFDGEINRLEARDYTTLTYANVNSGTYAWDSTLSLIGVNPQHNSGLLIFNSDLLYPNATALTSTYGITTGNFGAVTNSPVANVNYTSASGIRSYYRKFKSANGVVQSTITLAINHTGSANHFLTNPWTGGTVTGNTIKVEFLIMRASGLKHGWSNPFAFGGNPEGVQNITSIQSGTTMTVNCSLSTVPRIISGDIVVVRVFCASTYKNKITDIAVTNI